MRYLHPGAVAALVMVAGCSKPFVFEESDAAGQQAFLEAEAQGIYDGLEKTIPHGKNGVYMQMGPSKVDAERRRIEILVNVQNEEDEMPDFSGMSTAKLLRAVCPAYLAGDMNRNKVTVYVRFALPGGGTGAAVSANPQTCAPYATEA